MTAEEITRLVNEVERLWRSRTPPTRVDEMNASYRVGRGEMRLWCKKNAIQMDEFDEELQVELTKMFLRLRKEFPDQLWDAPNASMKDLCKRHGLRIPRTPNRRTDHG